MQLEATEALAIITFGNSSQIGAVVEHDAIPSFILLLSSDNIEIVEEALKALGNIAFDSPDLRDLVFDAGVIEPLKQLTLARNNHAVSFLQNVSDTIKIMCRNQVRIKVND